MPTSSASEIQTTQTPWYARAWLLLLAYVVVAFLVFHALWRPGAILMCSDNNVGNVAAERNALLVAPPHEWFAQLWGMPFPSRITLVHAFQMLLPPTVFTNTMYALCLVFGAWFLALFLRDKGLRPLPAFFGGLVAYWVGTNLTLIYAGHIGKYGVILFLAIALWALGRWGKTRRAPWAVIAAAAIGGMFLEQVDVAAFCTLLLVPAALVELFSFPRETLRAPRFWIVHILPAAIVGLLIVGGAAAATISSGVADNVDDMTPEQQWAYLTQWSQPPDESLDFIAPGWTGWRSGDEAAPYWGRMGRSDEWETTRQGFMNFKLENVYVGVIPFLFALIAIATSFSARKTSPDAARRWHLTLLWTCLCLAALLLSFGKFTPLYRPLTALPGFSIVRNPNKFIHFFQFAWAVLAAIGFDQLLSLPGCPRRRWALIAAALSGIFFIAWAIIWSDSDMGAVHLSSQGWPLLAARAIQHAKNFALFWCALSQGLTAAALWFSAPRAAAADPKTPSAPLPFWRRALIAIPLLMLLADAALILAPHYIQAMPAGYIAKNDAITYLQENLPPNRMVFPRQDALSNFWLTFLFLYYDIPTISATQVPHPPGDYVAFWKAVTDPIRLWRLTAVTHLFMPGTAAAQLLADPYFGPQFRPDWAFRPEDDGQGGYATRPLPLPDGPTPRDIAAIPQVVLTFRDPPNRVVLATNWVTVDDPTALRTLAAPDFTPLQTVILSPEAAETIGPDALSAATASPAPSPLPLPDVTDVRTGHIRFTVTTEGPALARIADKYDPGWRATLNDAPAPVLRCDYMFQAVWLPGPGTWAIDITYRPRSLPLLFQAAGLLLALVLVLPLLRRPACLPAC